MRIALITARYAPESSPGAKRATDLARALGVAGHRTIVLTQLPSYPDPAAFSDRLQGARRLTIERDPHGNETWRFRPTLASSGNLAARLAAEARFASRVSRLRTRVSGLDGVIASSPFVLNLVAARTYRAPMWLDLRDLTWEYSRSLGSRSAIKTLGSLVLRSLALASLRRASRVSTTTERQRRYLVEHGVARSKVDVIPNGVPRRVVLDLARRTSTGTAQGDGRPLRVVYAGLLGFPQGLGFAVESLAARHPGDIELHLHGEGVERAEIARTLAARRVGNVFLHPHVDYQGYLEVIARADVLFASLRPESAAAMPSKIWEYMAAARPIVFAGAGEGAEAVERARAGRAVPFGDGASLRACLDELRRDAALRAELGTNGREWVLRHQIREEINAKWVKAIEEAFAR